MFDVVECEREGVPGIHHVLSSSAELMRAFEEGDALSILVIRACY